MAFNSKHNRLSGFTFPMGIMKSLMLALGVTLLAACGSSDDFPAGNKSQQPDPLVTDIPLFYIERPLRPGDNGGFEPDNLKDPITFHGNARLIMKIRADQSAPSVNISARAVSGNVDVRDLDVSPDGNLVVFSLRAPQIEDADEEDQPTWNLWEYDIANDEVRRLISSDILAENGHDITPRYLPDGRIIFASTRQKKSLEVLRDEGKAGPHLGENRQAPALNLHILDPETQDITQVTFNQSHDLYPAVTNNGKVVFSRREHFNGDAISLYEMNPDGTQLQILYGHHSQGGGANTTNRYFRSNIMPNGDIFVLFRPDQTSFYGGDFVSIDTARYIDRTRPVSGFSGSGPAERSITGQSVTTNGSLSPGGYFSAFHPLWDNTGRAVVSWSRCRIELNGTTQPCNSDNVAAPGATLATPAYGIWIFDYSNNTQVPVIAAQEGIVYTDVVLASPRQEPTIIYDLVPPVDLVDQGKEDGAIHIRSVFDFDGATRNFGSTPPSYLRVTRAVSEPPQNAEGANFRSQDNLGSRHMREIIGYFPIAPDGSVKMKVPADVALSLSLVDSHGKALRDGTNRLLQHESWISVRPGEVLECKGCHTRASTAPHGRYAAQAPSINPGTTDAELAAQSLIPRLTSNLANHPEMDYSALPSATADPSNTVCLLSQRWSSGCPVVINYPETIQAIWEWADRKPLAVPDGQAGTQCTRCHSASYMVANAVNGIPPTQLELTSEQENGIRIRSYFELLNTRPYQIVDGGVLRNCTDVLVDVLDGNGEPVLDEDGNVVQENVCPRNGAGNPITTVTPPMSGNGATFSARFFDLFTNPDDVAHFDSLEESELRLIAEWLDIGAQYYNNHFAAPDN